MKPKVEEQKPTAQEIANFEISKDMRQNYEQFGIPAQDALIRRNTGLAFDAESGGYSIDPSVGVLNADGSVRTDTGRNLAAAQRQWQPLLSGLNPNAGSGRVGRVGLLADKMASDAQIAAGTQFGQQNGYLSGLQDAISVGRGQQAGLLGGLQADAGQAAALAGQDARQAFNTRLGNQQAFGHLVGMGSAYAMNQVPVVRKDGTYIKGAYDNAFKGWLGSL